jgi:cell division protein FtsQ
MPRREFPEDELASRPHAESVRAAMDAEENPDGLDGHALDLEPEEESPFLRAQKRVPVRRGPLPKKTVSRLKYLLAGLAAAALVALVLGGLYRFERTSPRFRLESSDAIQLTGNLNVTRAQVLEIFAGDISRNIFAISLGERKTQLEQIPWIESATVMRLLPNRLSVDIRERVPVAFVQMEGHPSVLADANGVLMEMPTGNGQQYSFPVITGLGEKEPASMRAASLRIYTKLLRELDSGGAQYSRSIDEVNLSDPEDVKISITDAQGQVLIHLGSSNFLERYKRFLAHIQELRQGGAQVDSVDMRYNGRMYVNPDTNPVTMPEAPQANAEPQVAPNSVSQKPAEPPAVKPARHKRAARVRR